MEVKMNKEIMDYREAMFFGLDFRQMACSLLAVLAAVGIYFSLRKTAGEEVTGWLCMLGAAPFAFCGFFRYHGMTAEQFAWAVVKSELLYPKRLLFQPEDLYYQCMEGRIDSGGNGKREKRAEMLRRKELKKTRKQAAARKRIQRKQTGRKPAIGKRMDRERRNRERMDRERMDRERMNRERIDGQTSGKRENREPIKRVQRNRKQSGRMQPERDQRNKAPARRNPAQNQRNKSSIQQPIRRRRDASD